MLSVSQVASLCGVGHSTVGYWIRANKLKAFRVGKQYSIPVEELIFYLESNGHKVPDALAEVESLASGSRIFQNCWQYFKDVANGQGCNNCIVFKNRVEICFTGKEIGSLGCPTHCPDCKYYTETYLPKIQFIHQISSPASISKSFYLWGGNKPWAELCGVSERDLPGMGIEKIFHADSLEAVISDIKKRALGVSAVSGTYRVYFKNTRKGKIGVRISVYGLDDPAGTLLFFAEPENR